MDEVSRCPLLEQVTRCCHSYGFHSSKIIVHIFLNFMLGNPCSITSKLLKPVLMFNLKCRTCLVTISFFALLFIFGDTDREALVGERKGEIKKGKGRRVEEMKGMSMKMTNKMKTKENSFKLISLSRFCFHIIYISPSTLTPPLFIHLRSLFHPYTFTSRAQNVRTTN